MLRTMDLIVPYAYAMVPTPLWQKYREMKSRYQAAAPKPTEGEAVS